MRAAVAEEDCRLATGERLALPGAPHLHFEVHPGHLLRLGYCGAVDPTTYLNAWPHLHSVEAPLPMHPRLPEQPLLQLQAREVFRHLLAARYVIETPASPDGRPSLAFPEGANRRSTEPARADDGVASTTAASADRRVPHLPRRSWWAWLQLRSWCAWHPLLFLGRRRWCVARVPTVARYEIPSLRRRRTSMMCLAGSASLRPVRERSMTEAHKELSGGRVTHRGRATPPLRLERRLAAR